MDTKALRQKVLDLAIRGKLVPQDPNDEPASVLLERIRQQKQQMVKEGKLKAKDIKNDTIIFVGEDNLHYEKFADGSVKCIEDEIPFELPDGWAWARLSSIAGMALGKMLDVAKNKGSFRPYLRNINVRWGTFELSDVLEMRFEDDELERYSIRRGDLVICEGGEPGRCAVWQSEEVVFYQKALHRVRAIEVLPEYLCYAISYFIISAHYERYYTGTTIKHLTGQVLRILPIPLPPMGQQRLIVKQLQQILEEIDRIEAEKTDALSLVALAKSEILDLAIRGQLVPQDPSDEPASVLLERIRAEKEELIRQGKIKRDKKESVIFRGEDNSYYEKIGEKVSEYDVDEFPYDWCVGSFSQVNMFVSEPTNPSNSPDEMFELYSVPNFEAGIPEIIHGKEIGSSKQSICENDVLVCKINPRINRVWVTGRITPYRLLGSSEWIVFRNHLLVAPYLRYYFSSPHFRKLMLSNVSGVGGSLMRAQPESVKKYPVLIPPYQEQIRIAERIDELFALLVAIEKSLN